MDKKYSVTTFWLSCVKQNRKGTVTWVNRWRRISKYYFRTKKEVVLDASENALHWTKTTIRREVK